MTPETTIDCAHPNARREIFTRSDGMVTVICECRACRRSWSVTCDRDEAYDVCT